MDAVLFEQLLYEEESDSLDFKRDQYPFNGATDDEKGELLKDILAFANSWKRSDAYILIGAEEIKGGKSNPVGITDDLDDAKLQQFVNSKTNKPLNFSYEPFVFDGNRFGIIKIPVQQRPFYITKNYGKLEKEKIYIRRGSSTAIAKPEEIILMGVNAIETPKPSIDLEFASKDSKEKLGRNLKLISKLVEYNNSNIKLLKNNNPYNFSIDKLYNENYYSEKAFFIKQTSFLSKVSFWIKNTGETLLSNVSLNIRINCNAEIKIIGDVDYPKYPSKKQFNLASMTFKAPLFIRNRIDVTLENKDTEKKWLINADFGDIRPKEEIWSNDFFCIGVTERLVLEMESLVFADNISEPIRIPLSFDFEVTKEELDFEKLYND